MSRDRRYLEAAARPSFCRLPMRRLSMLGRWSSIAIGASIAILSAGIWSGLKVYEAQESRRHVVATARDLSKTLSHHLHRYVAHLDYMTAVWERPNGQLQNWTEDAESVAYSLEPYRAISRLNAMGETLWTLPRASSAPISPISSVSSSLFHPETTAALATPFTPSPVTAGELPTLPASRIPASLTDDGSSLLLYRPLAASPQRVAGTIVAVMDVETEIAPYLSGTDRVAVDLQAGDTSIYRSHARTRAFRQRHTSAIVHPMGTWSLHVWPHGHGISSSYSAWCNFVLGGGLAAGAIAAGLLEARRQHHQYADKLRNANAALAGEVRDRARAEAALSQQVSQAALLRQLTHEVRSSLDWEHMLQTAAQAVGEALQVDRCVIHVGERDDIPGLHVVAEYTRSPYESAIVSLVSIGSTRNPYVRAVLMGDRAVVAHNVFICEWIEPIVDLCQSLRVKSLLAVRTSCQGTANGAIEIHQCDHFRQWTRDEIDLLEAIAAQVGIAIQQAELFGQQQRFNTILEGQVVERTAALQEALKFEAILQSITERILYERDEARILQGVTERLAERLNLSTCEINMVDAQTSTHTVLYESPRSFPSLLGHRFRPDDGISNHASLLQDGRPLYHCCKHPLVGWVAMVQCPIHDDRGTIGILNAIRTKDEAFSEAEIRLARQVANQCAIALRQARLYEAARQRIVDLQNLSILKDDFLSTVSHELRSPLANMKMALKMVQLIPDTDKQKRYLDVLEMACQQEVELVDDLLDLQRLEAQCYQLAIESIDLQAWLPAVVEPFRHRARERGLQLDIDLSAAPLEMYGDRSCVERVLRELLTNACKYSEDRGGICVKLETAAGSDGHSGVRFEVINPGEIPADELPRIFDKFYRVPHSDRWRQGGTGLGLALIKRMVEQLQGSIVATSEMGSTTFSLWLPAIPEIKQQLTHELASATLA
ncbi:MAG: GAF domain-containing protein [Cyanobacteria bacterium P01_D01_bin.123]